MAIRPGGPSGTSQSTGTSVSRVAVAAGHSIFSRAKWHSGSAGNPYEDGTNLYKVTQRQHRVLMDASGFRLIFANKSGYEIVANSLTVGEATNPIYVSCTVFVGCIPSGITGRTITQTIAVGDTSIKLSSVTGISPGALIRVNYASITDFRVIAVDAGTNTVYTDTVNQSSNFTTGNNPTITVLPTAFRARFSEVPTTGSLGVEAIVPPNGLVRSDLMPLGLKQSSAYSTGTQIVYTRTMVRVANAGERWPSGHICDSSINEGTVTDTVAISRTVTDGAITSGTKTLTSSTAVFVASDVGKLVSVSGAAGGSTLYATIASRTDATTVVLNNAQNIANGNASSTVSGATVTIGDYLAPVGVSSITAGTAYSYGPVLVLGQARSTTAKTVGALGDSILKGDSGSSNESWFDVFCQANGLGCVNMGRGGETASDLVDPSSTLVREALLASASTVFEASGVNDISNVVATTGQRQQLKIRRVTIWFRLYEAGQRVLITTITPRTTSTDTWATVTNQTVTASNPDRLDHNAWIRAGAPIDPTTLLPVAVGTAGALVAGSAGHPAYAVVDLCAAIEVNSANVLTQDGGFWKAAYTNDGLHPQAAAHAAMALIPTIAQVV